MERVPYSKYCGHSVVFISKTTIFLHQRSILFRCIYAFWGFIESDVVYQTKNAIELTKLKVENEQWLILNY